MAAPAGPDNVHPSSVFHPDTFRASNASNYSVTSIATLSQQSTGHAPSRAPSRASTSTYRPLRQSNPLNTVDLPSHLNPLLSSPSVPSSPVRRKPLPKTASHWATRFSSADSVGLGITTTIVEQPTVRYSSLDTLDSPTLHDFPPSAYRTSSSTPELEQEPHTPRPDPSEPQFPSYAFTQQPASPRSTSLVLGKKRPDGEQHHANHARLVSESALTTASASTAPWYGSSSTDSSRGSTTMSVFSSKPTPPHHIQVPAVDPRAYTGSLQDPSANSSQRLHPKTPSPSKLGTFFGWGGTVSSPDSATTTISDYSPIPSPQLSDHTARIPDAPKPKNAPRIPAAIDVPRANADAGTYLGSAFLDVPSAASFSPIQIDDMEKELKEISAELAASIRREMDLEDLVERLQGEAQNAFAPGRRTSDYFSDSGTSSVRYGDNDPKQDELDRMIRKTQQEKAQMKLELTEKVQDERSRRKDLEAQIRVLEDRASQADLASMNSLDSNGRLKELEATCEDLRRRLSEEKQVRENFEDLLTALKGELQHSHNERDNLREEIVPQLKARVEGLEAQAAEHEQLTYENSKIQQELQILKTENTTLINAQKLHRASNNFNSIEEESDEPNQRGSFGLSRSRSVAQPSTRSRPTSLSRSGSVKNNDSRETLLERVKDVELQRDALHQALKSLLERQEHQNRENQKKLKALEVERDRALSSPKRKGYDRDVSTLREEINLLRRRADEAIEQKWQCEKGLGGLKMDLDRAEQEIASLRRLLADRDPNASRRPASPGSEMASSASLERAYKDLQDAYSQSLERIKKLEGPDVANADTTKAIEQLEKTLAETVIERDFALHEVASLRHQSQSLQSHMGHEMALADELRASASRVEELAAQVRQQLASNQTLRGRLADAIERGEKDQDANAQRITFMQSKLKTLEDSLLSAQHATEERVTRHEEEMLEVQQSHNIQLQRVKDGLRSPRQFAPKSPISPMFANTNRAPRLSATSSGRGISISEDSKVSFLKNRVVELEGALLSADKEMEDVVGRMNVAQIEVIELQNEREEMVRGTKKLESMLQQERLKAFNGAFASLSS